MESKEICLVSSDGSENNISILLGRSEANDREFSLMDLIDQPLVLAALVSYYRYLLQSYDQLSHEDLGVIASQYKQLQEELAAWFSSKKESDFYIGLPSGLWQCLEEGGRRLVKRDIAKIFVAYPVLPVFQMRYQSIAALVAKRQRHILWDQNEKFLVERYFEDTQFFDSNPSIEEGWKLQKKEQQLFNGWVDYLLTSHDAPSDPVYQENWNMVLKTRSSEERHARIKAILAHSSVSDGIMEWLINVSVQEFTGLRFSELMKADVAECVAALKAKKNMRREVEANFRNIFVWVKAWLEYCECEWTTTVLGPQTVEGAGMFEKYAAREDIILTGVGDGLTAAMATKLTLPKIVECSANIVASAYPGPSGSSGLANLAGRVVEQNAAAYPGAWTGILSYFSAKVIWDQKERLAYYIKYMFDGQSPYAYVKREMRKYLENNILSWLTHSTESAVIMASLTKESIRLKESLAIPLVFTSVGSGVLLCSAERYNAQIFTDSKSFSQTWARLASAATIWKSSYPADELGSAKLKLK